MSYFVTGATGFIGRNLLERLLKRKGTIYCLVRAGSERKFDALRKRSGATADRMIAIRGDIEKPMCGLRKQDIAKLRGKISHFFHLAAFYDIMSDDEARHTSLNVEGTRHAVELAQAIKAGHFQYASSTAVAGMYPGYFREDMFEEAEDFHHPYFRSKHAAEGIVRTECAIPFRIYRPGIVVGDSRTGETDKPDGPYYVFKFIQKVRSALPAWVPLVGLEGGRINIVPVDFVVGAMDHLAHKRGLDGQCFHLTDPDPYRAGEVLNIVADAAHAPQFVMRINSRMLDLVPRGIREALMGLPPIRRIIDTLLADLGIPKEVFHYLGYPTRFDCRDTVEALKNSRIACPRLESYAPKIWDYWERHLDPDLFRDRSLAGAVRDRVVVVTGASSGIGRASAHKIAAAGAKAVLVARNEDGLELVRKEIEDKGGQAYVYTADLSDMEECDAAMNAILKEHGAVDILVNNAGRSIRRSIGQSYDRFHDYERLMQLNYFGAIRLILRVLPGMAERKRGQIINVSTMGVLANPPRFSAYVASKSALDAFSRCAQAEYLDKDIYFSTISMPLVRTPMIDVTGIYENVPALSADEAADMVVRAIVDKPRRIATRLGVFAQVMHAVLPNVALVVLNTAYKLFPDTGGPKDGEIATETPPSAEAVAFASLMRGIYW
jgi:NAD(P)-dependent dehydrogenase (short-subunit alcohol dehydrogenase family)